MKYLLIINPNAGKRKPIVKDLLELFKERKRILDIAETKKPGDGIRIAKKAAGKYKAVIAAGGDGTINEVVNGLAGTNTPIGIIPAGTENVLATELKIPKDHKKAGKKILTGKTKTFDLGKAGKRYFTLMAGIGLDAIASHNVEFRPTLKKMLGRNAYPIAAIQTYFQYKPKKLRIKLDDQVLPRWGYFAVVGNMKLYGGGLKITAKAKADDGYLDICIFKNKDIVNMLKYFIGARFKHNIEELPNIEYFKVKKIKITTEQKTMVHTDAEIAGTTPINIEAVPKAIKIIC